MMTARRAVVVSGLLRALFVAVQAFRKFQDIRPFYEDPLVVFKRLYEERDCGAVSLWRWDFGRVVLELGEFPLFDEFLERYLDGGGDGFEDFLGGVDDAPAFAVAPFPERGERWCFVLAEGEDEFAVQVAQAHVELCTAVEDEDLEWAVFARHVFASHVFFLGS